MLTYAEDKLGHDKFSKQVCFYEGSIKVLLRCLSGLLKALLSLNGALIEPEKKSLHRALRSTRHTDADLCCPMLTYAGDQLGPQQRDAWVELTYADLC